MSCSLNEIALALKRQKCLIESCERDFKEEKNPTITGTACDSRHVESDFLFVCKGKNFSTAYLEEAIKSGANSCLIESRDCEVEEHNLIRIGKKAKIPCLVTDNIRIAQAVASKAAWGDPDDKLKVIGITGTKGKTTVATFLKNAIDSTQDCKCGFVGTHRVFDGERYYEPPNTTPEPPDLYRFLANMVKNGCRYCVMEISSQGLKYDRVFGLSLDVGAITNIGIDHISSVEHLTVEDYIDSKFNIVKLCNKIVLPHQIALSDEVEARCEEKLKEIIDDKEKELNFYDEEFRDGETLPLSMIGQTSQKNARCALEICKVLGLDQKKAFESICDSKVEGRMEVFVSKDEKIVGIVDYAHTLESYDLFFADVKKYYPEGFIIAYFGASGGKATKRCLDLPKTAAKYCDYIIITSDDPGPEDPKAVVERCAKNIPSGINYEKIVSRDEACRRAFEVAKDYVYGERSKKDSNKETKRKAVVCALGKGSESVCVCGGKREDISIIPDTSHVAQLIKSL